MSDAQDFQCFMKRREQAAQAYVNGDPAPLSNMSADENPATFFSPMGGFRQGAHDVSSTYARDAGLFDEGSITHFEILHTAAGNGVAYWTGFQRASVRMKGKADPVPFDLRVTEIFRREGDDWKLVHRHADTLMSAPKAG